MQRSSKIDVDVRSSRTAPATATAGMEVDAARFLARVQELREQYLSEMEDQCTGSEHPEFETRALLASWFAEFRAEYESRLTRLEMVMASLGRQHPRH